jgi:hypothetical protein
MTTVSTYNVWAYGTLVQGLYDVHNAGPARRASDHLPVIAELAAAAHA